MVAVLLGIDNKSRRLTKLGKMVSQWQSLPYGDQKNIAHQGGVRYLARISEDMEVESSKVVCNPMRPIGP